MRAKKTHTICLAHGEFTGCGKPARSRVHTTNEARFKASKSACPECKLRAKPTLYRVTFTGGEHIEIASKNGFHAIKAALTKTGKRPSHADLIEPKKGAA